MQGVSEFTRKVMNLLLNLRQNISQPEFFILVTVHLLLLLLLLLLLFI